MYQEERLHTWSQILCTVFERRTLLCHILLKSTTLTNGYTVVPAAAQLWCRQSCYNILMSTASNVMSLCANSNHSNAGNSTRVSITLLTRHMRLYERGPHLRSQPWLSRICVVQHVHQESLLPYPQNIKCIDDIITPAKVQQNRDLSVTRSFGATYYGQSCQSSKHLHVLCRRSSWKSTAVRTQEATSDKGLSQ
jgi:hypothetical protein